jgi:phage gp29-like protein
LYEEFLPELLGKRGVEAYKEMANNDDIISAFLYVIQMLMRQAKYSVEPGGDTDKDKEAANFVEECMNDMQMSWTDTISEILSFLTYGWSYHEIVYKRRMGKTKNPMTYSKYDDGLIGWRKLPIRSQDTLWEWKFDEETDELLGMIQSPPPRYGQIFIPLEKALHFITKSEKQNPEGKSILRGAYRAHYFKKRIQEIEGIGLERDLAGFPVIYGPEGIDLWDSDDPDMVNALAAAETIVTGIRQDSRAGLVMPNGWKLELLSAGNRKMYDTGEIIERYDRRIAGTVLADFILLGQSDVGSFALSSDKTKLFSVAIGTFLDVICDTFNTQGIPRLIDINGDHFSGITDYPRMVHGDVEDADLEKLAKFLQTMVGIGVLMPDEELEDYVRREGKLPARIARDPDGESDDEEMKEFRRQQAMNTQQRSKENEEEQESMEKALKTLGRVSRKKKSGNDGEE